MHYYIHYIHYILSDMSTQTALSVVVMLLDILLGYYLHILAIFF